MRSSIIALALGVFSCLMAFAIWWARPIEAATVRTLAFSDVPRGEPAPARLNAAPRKPSERLSTLPAAPEIIQRVTRAGHYVLCHPDAVRADGSYDVVIHFHGIPQALEPALRESGLRAVLLVLESGTFTGDYNKAFGQPGSLARLLKSIRGHVSAIVKGRAVHEQRVAVSAWSAGSGAVIPMLKRATEAALLDAVVLSDSLHSSFIEPLHRTIGDAQLEPVRRFAAEAMEGRKYFALSHTAIETVKYASTTETANQLLQSLHLSPVHIVDPLQSKGPFATTRTEKGQLSILGFDGQDRRAHARQQWAIGRLLWVGLAKRWNRLARLKGVEPA